MHTTDTLGTGDRGKRVVTTDGTVLGRVVSVEESGAYIRPERGLMCSTDSWIAPSWDECRAVRLDERAVVGVGESAVVLDPDADTLDGGDDRRGVDRADDETAAGEPDGGTRREGETRDDDRTDADSTTRDHSSDERTWDALWNGL